VKAERKHATVMFADIEGFTALSEKSGAERAYFAVTGCLKLLDGVARKHGGSVDKYMGDAIMAVFGYPVPLEQAARAAVHAAVEMRQCVRDYNRELRLELPLDVRIGVNTGHMVAGDIRGPVIREFHVLGDAVNVAARIKARASLGTIYVGPETHEATKEQFEFADLEPLKLKGKDERVATYEVVAARKRTDQGGIGSGEMVFSRLVGRKTELDRLSRCVTRLESGSGGVAVLIGEKGMGKSRLLAELEREAPSAPLTILRARASSVDSQQPLHCITRLLRSWSALDQDGGERGSHAALESALRRVLPGEPQETLSGLSELLAEASSPDPGRRPGESPSPPAVDASVARWLQGLASQRPLVAVIEDLQWADPGSLDLLEGLLPLANAQPILFLLSLRPPRNSAVHRTLSSARGRFGDGLVEIHLGPLPAEEARELVGLVLGNDELPQETLSLVEERAAGNPARLIMGSFLTPALHSESERGAERSSEGERRRATILFADISGFTAMTEKLGPEKTYPIVASCLALLDGIARKHGGTVDKYLGDCVMALFGVPEAIEDAPRAAVNAAIEMRQQVFEFNRREKLASPLDVHTGIHTGLGISGDISGPLIREFAVMGDPVDVADELKDLAPSGSIYVGPETERLTRDVFEFRRSESIELRGQDFETFEVLSKEPKLYRARIGAERQIFSALVGRDEELEQLKDRVRRSCAGQGGIATLVAEAGIGKSRLIAELGASSEAERVTWLEGRSLSTGQQLSFHPFADLCRSWSRIEDSDDDEEARRKVESWLRDLLPSEAHDTFPFVASIMGMPLDPSQQERLAQIQGDALEKMIRRSVAELLRQSSQRQAVVVVMDDLHWADLSSVELLESLLRLTEELPILFLNVTRPGFAETSGRVRQLAEAEHAPRHLRIHLEPLRPQAARELVNNLFKQGDIPHATRTLIEEKAQGNPFYIEEVVRSLVDEGAVEYREGSFRATDRIYDVVIPGTVQEVIMARVDRLDLRKKKLLQIASVIGRSFHREVLDKTAGESERLKTDLVDLQGAEFIVPWDQMQGEEYAFKHPLIQEVTYDGILQSKREELHRQVAEAIESVLPAEVPGYSGMLAYHFSMGRDVERAEEFLFRAGDEAAKVAASSEALNFFQQASSLYFEIHGEGGDPQKKANLVRKIATALYYRGQFIEAVEYFNRALEFLNVPVPRRQGIVVLHFVRNILAVLTRIYVTPRRRLNLRPATDRQREVIALMFDRARAQTTTSPTRFLFDSMDTIGRLQRVDPGSVPGSASFYATAIGLFSYGGISFDISRRFLQIADELVHPDDAGELMTYRVMNFIHRTLEGDWADEHEVETSLIDESLRNGMLWEIVTYLTTVAEKHIHQGRFDRAQEHLEQIDKIWDHYQYDLAKTNHYYQRPVLALERRCLGDAVSAADDYFDENPEDLLHITALGFKAEAQTLLGDFDGAEATLSRNAELVSRSGPIPPFHLSNFTRARFRRDLAQLEEAQQDGEWARRRGLQRRARRSARAALRSNLKVSWRRAEALRLAGRLHWLRGRRASAFRLWRRSLAAARQIGARPELARTQMEIGLRLLELRSRRPELDGVEAAAYLDDAAKTFEALELRWDLDQLRRATS
jgi:class 3 adenylate cyclase/tetratricopeptide (TPR) repeat protein